MNVKGLLLISLTLLDLYGMEYYVSPQGDDEAAGTLAAPFETLDAAVQAVRTWRNSGGAGPAIIYLREGRHQLNSTLVLGLSDGDPNPLPAQNGSEPGAGTNLPTPYLTFAAYQNEVPVVSAGVPVTGWQLLQTAPAGLPTEADGNVWVADMPAGMDRFYTMYDANGRLPRARDDAGFNATSAGTKTTVTFPGGALQNWSNMEDVEIHVRPYRPWVINMLPLASVNTNTNTATTATPATYNMGPLPAWVHNPSGSTVWVENVLEALDRPGEWVVNTVTRKIYLWPRESGTPQGILTPSTSELIKIEGTINYDGPTDIPVRGIAFKWLTFSHGDRKAWGEYEQRQGWGLQHDWDMFDSPTALLRFRGAENCLILQCTFENSGGSGVRMDLHAQRNRVIDSEFRYLGEAGVLMAGYGPGTKDVNKHNEVINCLIHDFGEISWHSPAYWAWQSGHNLIKNNHLHHCAYAAILITNRITPDRGLNGEGGRTVRHDEIDANATTNITEDYEGWIIREPYHHSRHNVVEYNEITHVVQKLSDGNGIYISGAGTGNIIRYNYLHDNIEETVPAVIRCDDDQHETLIYGNVLYNNYGHTAAIASKGVNDIINNFIVDQRRSPIRGYISFEWEPVTGSVVRRNIVISHPDGGDVYGETAYQGNTATMPQKTSTDMDSNLYYHPTDNNWVNGHFQTMRAIDKELNSRFGDPLFVNPASEDFGFQPGSPALAIGIEPLDVSLMGRQEDFVVKTIPKAAAPLDFKIWNQGRALYLRLPEGIQNVGLSIYSPSGKTMAEYILSSMGRSSVTLPELSEGMYLARIDTDGNHKTKLFYYSPRQ